MNVLKSKKQHTSPRWMKYTVTEEVKSGGHKLGRLRRQPNGVWFARCDRCNCFVTAWRKNGKWLMTGLTATCDFGIKKKREPVKRLYCRCKSVNEED